MRVEGPVADVAQEEPVLVVGRPADLAPLALLALPSGPDHRRDPRLRPRVEVVLAASRAEQQVLEAVDGQLGDLAVLPRSAVVQVFLVGLFDCSNLKYGEDIASCLD